MYVACTRARDHVILTGQHAHDDDDDTDYPYGFEAPEPADAKTWQDWVQATLFDAEPTTEAGDGEHAGAEHALTELVETGSYERTLPYELGGDHLTGSITIRQPPERHAYEPTTDSPTLDLEAYDPPREQTEERVLSISPHECSKLAAGDGSLTWRDDTTLVYDAPDYDPSEYDDAEPATTGGAVPGGLPATAFGTVVHRLCELQPPEDDVPDLVRQLLTTAHQRGELAHQPDDQQLEEVSAAAHKRATRAEDAVAALSADFAITAQYDEFQVDAEFDGIPELDVDTVTVTGEIDTLLVTDDAYYVIDYKTDRPGTQEPDSFLTDRANHHQPQIFAYAAALTQLDSSRTVHASLIFTEIDGGPADWHTIEEPWNELVKMLD